MHTRSVGFLVCLLIVGSYGCSGDGSALPDGAPPDGGDDAGPDAAHDAGPDSGPYDGGPGDGLVVDRWAARLAGAAIQVSIVDRDLYVGTRPVYDLAAERPRGGIARVDLDDGSFSLLETALPRIVDPTIGSEAPVATAGVMADGSRRIAVARDGLLRIDTDPVEHVVLTGEGGAPVSPTHAVVDVARRRIWVSTGVGLFRLDADTMEVEARLGEAVLGAPSAGPLALVPDTGAVLVVAYAEDGSSRALRVVDDAVQASFVPGEGGAPAGLIGDLVWSARRGTALIALATWDEGTGGVVSWDGRSITSLVGEGALAQAARGERGPFGTARLALDDDAGLLIIGGQLRPAGPTLSPIGGGLVFMDMDAEGRDPMLAGLSTTTSLIPGDHVVSIAYDPATLRTFLSLRQPCSETRLGNAGVVAVHFEEGEARFEQPFLSGVRGLTEVGGDIIAVLRDDIPGLRCEGIPIETGMVQLQSDRKGGYVTLGGRLNPGFDAVRTAFDLITSDSSGRIIATGARQAIFVGPIDNGLYLEGPLGLGTSLWAYDAAWLDEHTFVIGGSASHDPGDPPEWNDVGPRGAARVTLADDGSMSGHQLYVHAARDPMGGVIEGLPSSEVRAVVPTGDGGAYLIAATERVGTSGYDRQEHEPLLVDGAPRLGGIVRLAADGSFEVVAGGDEVPDGRAAALASDNALWVLDAERGLLRMDRVSITELDLPVEVPAGSVPRTLWLGDDLDMVAGYSTGALIRLGDSWRFLSDVGTVWTVLPLGAGAVMLGTDEGVVTVRLDTVTIPEVAAPAAGLAPPFRAIAEGPLCEAEGGSCSSDRDCCEGLTCDAGACAVAAGCLGEHEVCREDADCCAGLRCAGSGFVTECLP